MCLRTKDAACGPYRVPRVGGKFEPLEKRTSRCGARQRSMSCRTRAIIFVSTMKTIASERSVSACRRRRSGKTHTHTSISGLTNETRVALSSGYGTEHDKRISRRSRGCPAIQTSEITRSAIRKSENLARILRILELPIHLARRIKNERRSTARTIGSTF